jgi:DNA-binding transcriptional LysR family regulator
MVDKPYDDLVAGLSCGNIDLIVGSVRPQSPDSKLREHVLFQNTLAVLARSGHRIHEKKNLSVSDLLSCKWVMPSVGAPSRDYFETLFASHGMTCPRDIVETDSLVAVRSLLTEDDRLTMTSPYRASMEIKMGVLRIVPYNIEGFSSAFGYLIRSQPMISPCLTAFLQTLQRLSNREVHERIVSTAA